MPAIVNKRLLGDALIGVSDDIRSSLRRALGTRPYRLAQIVRTWSGGRVGEGTPIDLVTEFGIPNRDGVHAPLIELNERGRYGPGGQERDGDLVVTELSLTYTEAELVPVVPPGTEVVWRVSEQHGQEQRERFYVISGQPVARRGDRPGDRSDWKIYLRRTVDMTAGDGADTE